MFQGESWWMLSNAFLICDVWGVIFSIQCSLQWLILGWKSGWCDLMWKPDGSSLNFASVTSFFLLRILPITERSVMQSLRSPFSGILTVMPFSILLEVFHCPIFFEKFSDFYRWSHHKLSTFSPVTWFSPAAFTAFNLFYWIFHSLFAVQDVTMSGFVC